MLISARRLRRCQFFQLLTSCFVLSLMALLVQEDNSLINHVKSYSYRYLINSYDFVNDSLSVPRDRPDGAPSYRYLINNRDKCQNEDVLLLLFVKTSPENRRRRNAIRKTWGNEDYIRSQYAANIKVVFALGIEADPVKSHQTQKDLVIENKRFNDLIQQDFKDTFHNLTLKLLLQFGLPIETQDFWIGRVHRGSPPIRSKTSKYYVPYEMYPWSSYPDYTAGAAYVVSKDVAAKVYEASQTLNTSLYIDDVFMGICANKMGVVPQYHVYFAGEGKAPYHPCIYNKMITSHGHLDDLDYLWRQATDPNVKSLSAGVLGGAYCKLVNIMLLCKLSYVDTYPCSAAWS
uniref:Hexosyltransferase n=1 Tax=Xenopus tropicalis TaxID=8364 RepID=A0A803KDY3_XENTR